MATEGDAYGTSLKGTRSADASLSFLPCRASAWWPLGTGRISGQRGFLRNFCTATRSFPGELFFPKSANQLFPGLCMGFCFEILSEGSLVSLFGNPRFLFFWRTGVHSGCVICDLFTDTEYLFFWLVVGCPVKPRRKWGR
jgi:hypothetical protein